MRSKKNRSNPNEKLIVIVSDPVNVNTITAYWLDSDAKVFRYEIKKLYMESFSLAVIINLIQRRLLMRHKSRLNIWKMVLKKLNVVMIAQTCKRTIFESLAGEIKSVPNLNFAGCDSGASVVSAQPALK